MTELGNFVATLIGLKWIIKAIVWLIKLPFRILWFPIALLAYIGSALDEWREIREYSKRWL